MRKVILMIGALAIMGGGGYWAWTKNTGGAALMPAPTNEDARADFSAEEKQALHDSLDDLNQRSEKYDEDYQSLASQKAAQEMVNETLVNMPEEQKIIMAANVFSGYIARNTLGINSYCSAQGVDVSNFTAKFIKSHEALAKVARKYYQVENQVELAYQEMQTQVLDMVDQEMTDVAAALKLGTTAESCQWMNAQADLIVEKAAFKNIMPSAYLVLDMAGK